MRIIIGIILCLFLMQASASWARTELGCHSRYSYSLDGGDTSIDVAHQENISLSWALPEKSNRNPEYSARVTDNYGYFECQIKHLSIVQRPQNRNCLNLTVAWRPGTDTSGCFVKIFKDGEVVRRAELYMNY